MTLCCLISLLKACESSDLKKCIGYYLMMEQIRVFSEGNLHVYIFKVYRPPRRSYKEKTQNS